MTLIDAKRPADWQPTNNPADCAEWLGLSPFTGLLSWDIFDAVLTPGHLILMLSWKDKEMAEDFEGSAELPEGALYAACGSSATTACMIDARRFRSFVYEHRAICE